MKPTSWRLAHSKRATGLVYIHSPEQVSIVLTTLFKAHIICNIGGTRGVKARPSGLLVRC